MLMKSMIVIFREAKKEESVAVNKNHKMNKNGVKL